MRFPFLPYLCEGAVRVLDDADRTEVVEVAAVALQERSLLLHQLDLHVLFVRVNLDSARGMVKLKAGSLNFPINFYPHIA